MGNFWAPKVEKIVATAIQLCLISYLCLAKEKMSLEFLCAFSLINTVIVVLLVCKIGKQLFSVSSMFMLFLAVFHFGQAWLYIFDAKVDKAISYDIFSLYPDSTIFEILMFSLLSYDLIAVFWILFSKTNATLADIAAEQQSENNKYDKKIILNFGTIFFFVLLIPVLIYDYKLITIEAQHGHAGLYENAGELSIWAAANSYFPLAIIMVLLGSDPKKNGWKWMFYYAVGRCLLLMMLTGKRGSFVIPLLLYLYCKHRFIKRYKSKHIIWIALASVLLVTMISFIAHGRGDYSDMNFLEFLQEENIFVQILSELGGTFTTTILSYNYAISHGALDGKSLLGALSTFVPMSDTLFPNLKGFSSVSALLNPYSPSGGALGGSLFGEMYINFKNYALLLTPLYAWAISTIENVISDTKKRHSLFAICSSIYISYGFWIYVRGNLIDVVFIVKRTIYVLIIYWIFKDLIGRRRMAYEKKSVNRLQQNDRRRKYNQPPVSTE